MPILPVAMSALGQTATMGAGVASSGLISSFINPVLVEAVKQTNNLAPAVLPDISSMVQMWRYGLISSNELTTHGRELGFDDSFIGNFIDISQTNLSLESAAILYRLGVIDDAKLDWYAQIHGIDARTKQMMMSLNETKVTPIDAVQLRVRGFITTEQYLKTMLWLGYTEDTADKIYELVRPQFAPDQIITALRRGFIAEPDADRMLGSLGYQSDDIALIKNLTQYYPGVADLILFAVREVYSPDIRATYGLDDDYPVEFSKAAAKAGLSEEFAKDYWAAHWDLPSISQGYEMMHRGVISKEELNTLLRTKDVMPYWREKLMEISYNPLTRVDIRRLYARGIIDRDGVKRAYLDGGYNEQNAEYLTAFTVEEYTEDVKTESKGEIVSGYKLGVISPSDAMTKLQTLEYTFEDASAILATADQQQINASVGSAISNLVSQYSHGSITESDLSARLDALGVDYRKRDLVILDARSRVDTAIKYPTKAELCSMLKKGIINITTFRDNMTVLGYESVWIDRYIELYSSSTNGAT